MSFNRFLITAFIAIAMLGFSLSADSSTFFPKITQEFDVTPRKLTRLRLINETDEKLLCYIAIDGYKRYFKINPYAKSRWYKATSKRFDYMDFSTWCGFARHYPNK